MLKKTSLLFYLLFFFFFSNSSFAAERNDKNLLTFGGGIWDWNDAELGHIVEFRSGLDLAYRKENGGRIGVEVHHLSNASLDENNPGTETFLFTYSIPLN